MTSKCCCFAVTSVHPNMYTRVNVEEQKSNYNCNNPKYVRIRTFQTPRVPSVTALAMIFSGFTKPDKRKPEAMACAILPPPIKPIFALSAMLIMFK